MELARGRFRLEKNHPTVWILIALCVIVNLVIDPSHSILPRLARYVAYALVVCCLSERWYKWPLAIVIMILCSGGAFYHTGADRIVQQASPIPINAVAEVDASVIPGGDRLEICTPGGHMLVRICYYRSDGRAAAAAHRSSMELGDYRIGDGEGFHLPDLVSVIENTDHGLVVEGYPPTPPDRSPLPIANAAEIEVGASAMVLQGEEPPIGVEVKGYEIRNGKQMLVLIPVVPDPRLGPGCSGSPVVQDGKIIGFIHSGVMIKNPVSYARLAADIYNGIEARLSRR